MIKRETERRSEREGESHQHNERLAATERDVHFMWYMLQTHDSTRILQLDKCELVCRIYIHICINGIEWQMAQLLQWVPLQKVFYIVLQPTRSFLFYHCNLAGLCLTRIMFVGCLFVGRLPVGGWRWGEWMMVVLCSVASGALVFVVVVAFFCSLYIFLSLSPS